MWMSYLVVWVPFVCGQPVSYRKYLTYLVVWIPFVCGQPVSYRKVLEATTFFLSKLSR